MNILTSLFYAITLIVSITTNCMEPSVAKIVSQGSPAIQPSPMAMADKLADRQEDLASINDHIEWISETPKELWIPCIAYCESKDSLRKTCTYFHDFITQNKEEILTNELLQLSPKVLHQFFIYYGALGKANIVANLLSKSADPNSCDNEHNSLMHYAARYGYNEMASLLLKHPAFIATNIAKDINSPLYLAIQYNQTNVIQDILSSCKVNHGEALCYAAKKGWFNGVQTLLAHNIDVNVTDNKEASPLLYAIKEKNITIAKLLIDHSADINSTVQSNDNEINALKLNPLLVAVINNDAAMTQLLLEHGADVNIKSMGNLTLLHLVSKEEHSDLITLLLDYGASIDIKNDANETPLDIAKTDAIKEQMIAHKKTDTSPLQRYLQDPENVASLNLDTKTLEQLTLYYGALGDCAHVRTLLSCGVDPNIRDNNNMSLMHYAAQYGYGDIVALLLEHPLFNQNHIADDEASPLCLAAKYNQLDVIKQLMITCTETIKKEEALCYAVKKGLFDVIDTLLKLKIDPNSVDNEGEFPLWYAVGDGDSYLPIMQLLITHGANVNQYIEVKNSNFSGCTALHLAAILGHKYTAQLLINHDADVNLKTANDVTPLHGAVEAGNAYIVELLISKGAQVNEKDNVGKTALHYAIKDINIIAMLLTCSEINVNERDNDGNTPLHLAIENGNIKIVQQLLERDDIIINSQNNQGKTPLDATEKIQRWYYDEGPEKDQSDRKKIQQLLIAHGGKTHSQIERDTMLDKCKDGIKECVVQ